MSLLPLASTVLLAASSTLFIATTDVQDTPAVTIVMEQTTTKKGKLKEDESGTTMLTLNGSKLGQTMRLGDAPPVTIIFDNEEGTMTTVATDKKGKVSATVMPRMKLGSNLVKNMISDYQKTDETKSILGYDARKYIITHRFGTTEAWMAEIPGVSWGEVVSKMTGDAAARRLLPLPEELPNAIALAGTTTSKDGKRVTEMEVTSIQTGADADLSPTQIPAGAEVSDLAKMMGF